MKHHCKTLLHFFLLLLLPLLISAFTSSNRVQKFRSDLVSSDIEAKVEGDGHQIVQRDAMPRRRRQRKGRRKAKEEVGSKKCKEGRNCEKKPKGKKQEGEARKPGNNLKRGRKQEKQLKKAEKGQKRERSGLRGRERQSEVNVTACITKLIFYSRLNEKKASAISRQVKRIKGNDKIQGSKGNKKSDFNSTKERLLSALGGNASNPTCGGQPFNSTASNSTSGRTFSQDTLTTLVACETEIADKCGKPTTGNATKLAELEACETLANNFKSEFSKCFAASKSMDESCTCVEAISESDVASMQACDVSGDNSAALKAKKACKAAVGKCKTAEAAAVEGIDTCKGETKCTLFEASQAEGTRLIEEVLTPLNEALKNPAFSNALNASGLSSGAGSDGQLPSSRHLSMKRRTRRQATDGTTTTTTATATDGTGCTELDEEWTRFNVFLLLSFLTV